MNSKAYEYTYNSPNPDHSHQYLARPILSLINQIAHEKSGKYIDPSKGMKILDLGCGNGSFTNFLASQGFNVFGIDESSSGIIQAQKSYPKCRFQQGSIYSLDLTEFSQKFDIVLSAEVIEHLFYPKELIRVAKECLCPGGHFILTTPYHGYIKNLVLALTGKLDSHFTVLWDGGHIKFFSVPTLRQLILSEGFVNPEFRFSGRFPYLWKTMVCTASFSSEALNKSLD